MIFAIDYFEFFKKKENVVVKGVEDRWDIVWLFYSRSFKKGCFREEFELKRMIFLKRVVFCEG